MTTVCPVATAAGPAIRIDEPPSQQVARRRPSAGWPGGADTIAASGCSPRSRCGSPPRRNGAHVRQSSSTWPALATSAPASVPPPSQVIRRWPERRQRFDGGASGRPSPHRSRPRCADRPASVVAPAVVVSTIDRRVGQQGIADPPADAVTTAIGGIPDSPAASRNGTSARPDDAGRYPSARVVPAPARTTSASARCSAKTRVSVSLLIDPRPAVGTLDRSVQRGDEVQAEPYRTTRAGRGYRVELGQIGHGQGLRPSGWHQLADVHPAISPRGR